MEQEELKVDDPSRAYNAQQESAEAAEARQASEAAVRASIATMSSDSLQELLAQRLSESRVL